MKIPEKKLYKQAVSISVAVVVVIVCFIIFKPISHIGSWLSASPDEPIKYSESDKYPVSIENITLDSMPSNVICLDVNALNELVALGYIDIIKGVCDGYEGEGFSEYKHFGSVQNPDFDAILSEHPDLLITSYPIPKARMSDFGELGIKVLVLPAYKIEDGSGENNYTAILSLIGGNLTINDSETNK